MGSSAGKRRFCFCYMAFLLGDGSAGQGGRGDSDLPPMPPWTPYTPFKRPRDTPGPPLYRKGHVPLYLDRQGPYRALHLVWPGASNQSGAGAGTHPAWPRCRDTYRCIGVLPWRPSALPSPGFWMGLRHTKVYRPAALSSPGSGPCKRANVVRDPVPCHHSKDRPAPRSRGRDQLRRRRQWPSRDGCAPSGRAPARLAVRCILATGGPGAPNLEGDSGPPGNGREPSWARPCEASGAL